eukprot:scaffold63407_cov63-Phaeocystis_antarctica.AAC.2
MPPSSGWRQDCCPNADIVGAAAARPRSAGPACRAGLGMSSACGASAEAIKSSMPSQTIDLGRPRRELVATRKSPERARPANSGYIFAEHNYTRSRRSAFSINGHG